MQSRSVPDTAHHVRSRLSALVILTFAVALGTTAQAEWTIVSANFQSGRAGVVHRHIVLKKTTTAEHADVDLAIFATPASALRVIDNPRGEMDLRQAMTRENCAAGVNGGYFDQEFAPIGLRIIDGKLLSPLRRARLITGVLITSARGVRIIRVGEFSKQRDVVTALQCGPFLVDAGQRVRGLDGSRLARRTFVATGTHGQAALGICSVVSLAQLSEILCTPKLSGELRIQRALNLDGGSSSAFWFARENGSAFSIPEQKAVRDLVAVIPR